jgi:uncharacterized protein YndB with AHSA1/START domain
VTGPARVLVLERHVKAPPEVVFAFFADPARWLQWQGVRAQVEPRPGGVLRMDVTGDGYASGRFVEVTPPRRLVFTWGWEVDGSPVPPGSWTCCPTGTAPWCGSPTATCPPTRSHRTVPAGRTTWSAFRSARPAATPAPTRGGSADPGVGRRVASPSPTWFSG